jgi:hypothetical protein
MFSLPLLYLLPFKIVKSALEFTTVYTTMFGRGEQRVCKVCTQTSVANPEVVCTVRLAIGFLLVLSKWCAQSRLAIGF